MATTLTKMSILPHGFEEIHNLHHHADLLTQTSTWIADVADAAADVAADDSLWEKYIRLYRNGLAFVHDNIVDEPLRKMGFEQTWGVSIFLFTAGR